MEKREIDNYLLREDICSRFHRQLVKDFEGAGIATRALVPLSADPVAVRGLLLDIVTGLLHDGEQLPRLLYRVDVSESQLRSYSRKYPSLTFAEVVTELIIMRTLQKVILRKKFSDG